MKPTCSFFPLISEYHPERKQTLSKIGICLIILASLASSGLPSPLYAVYQKQFLLSNFWVNILFSAYAIGVLVTLLAIMAFGDKVTDRRQIILFSGFLLIISALCLIFSENIWQLITGRFISGIATGSLLGSANAALLELNKHKDPRITAILSTLSFTCGSALGPMLSGFFIKLSFYPTTLPYVCLITLTMIAIPLIMLTKIPVHQHETITRETEKSSSSLKLYFSPPFIVSALTLVSGWGVGAVFMSSGQLFTTQLAHVNDVFLAAALITTFQLSAGVGQLLGGRFNQINAVIGGAILFAGSQVLMCLFAVQSFTLLYAISSMLIGFGYGIAFVGATGNVNLHAPAHQRARYISAYYIVGYIFGNAVPAVVVGSLIDKFSLKISMISFTSWILIVAFVLIYFSKQLSNSKKLN